MTALAIVSDLTLPSIVCGAGLAEHFDAAPLQTPAEGGLRGDGGQAQVRTSMAGEGGGGGGRRRGDDGGIEGTEYEVSGSIIEALELLRDHLWILSQFVHPDLRQGMWRKIAKEVDTCFYERVVADTALFSPSGAAQLQVDMAAIKQLFKPFTARPDNFLKLIKESLVLLTMPTRLARRLSAVLSDPQARNQEDTLHETGVSLLTLSQARVLCGKRTDLIASTTGAQI
mmetsp:Transcript_65347/g.105882  ORF Transcript_65347/g.105882 Transcript_65347/m.105882 type:complete len:228 (+) Transcript_65347:490-1173(+)